MCACSPSLPHAARDSPSYCTLLHIPDHASRRWASDRLVVPTVASIVFARSLCWEGEAAAPLRTREHEEDDERVRRRKERKDREYYHQRNVLRALSPSFIAGIIIQGSTRHPMRLIKHSMVLVCKTNEPWSGVRRGKCLQ